MQIAVCCKLTPDTEDIRPTADGIIDISKANWSVSEYDLQAIQAAADIKGDGDEVIAITVGTCEIAKSKHTKALMSRGDTDRLVRIADAALDDADGSIVAKILAAAITRTAADVVLFGEGSSDRYARTTGSLVAAELGWPCVNAVVKIDVNEESIIVEREMEDGFEIVSLPIPCAIVTTSTINTPSLPTMKAVLAAGKKPIDEVSIGDLGVDLTSRAEIVAREIPERPGRQQIILEGSPEQIAGQLISKLKSDQVL